MSLASLTGLGFPSCLICVFILAGKLDVTDSSHVTES